MATIVTIVTTLQCGITRNWSKCLSDHKKLGGRCRCRVTGPWWWCDPCLPSRNKAKILKHPVAVGECYRVTLELILDCSPPPDLVAAMSVHWPRVACSCSCIYLWHYCVSISPPLIAGSLGAATTIIIIHYWNYSPSLDNNGIVY